MNSKVLFLAHIYQALRSDMKGEIFMISFAKNNAKSSSRDEGFIAQKRTRHTCKIESFMDLNFRLRIQIEVQLSSMMNTSISTNIGFSIFSLIFWNESLKMANFEFSHSISSAKNQLNIFKNYFRLRIFHLKNIFH